MSILHNPFARILVLVVLFLGSASVAVAQEATPEADANVIEPDVSRGVRGTAPDTDSAVLGLWRISIEPGQSATLTALDGAAIGIVESGMPTHFPAVPAFCALESCSEPASGSDFVWPENEPVTLEATDSEAAVVLLAALTSSEPTISTGTGTLDTVFAYEVPVISPGAEIALTVDEFKLDSGSRAKLTSSDWAAVMVAQNGNPVLAAALDDDVVIAAALATPVSAGISSLLIEPGEVGAVEALTDSDPARLMVVALNDMTFEPMPGCAGRCLRGF